MAAYQILGICFPYLLLGAIHMIREWHSFWNEFIPSQYIYFFISFPYKTFQDEFVPLFNLNEILVLVRNFVLVSCNWKRTVIWIRKIANFVLWGEWCMLSDLVQKPCEWECLRLRLDFRLLPGSAFDPSWSKTLLGGMSAGSFSQTLAGNGGHLRGASLFYHVNAAWTLFWNETHSGMKVAAVQYDQPINLTSVVWSSV